jgi:hypothetical protein
MSVMRSPKDHSACTLIIKNKAKLAARKASRSAHPFSQTNSLRDVLVTFVTSSSDIHHRVNPNASRQ